jgi:murein DD-endopeptidase MepM/ murein hydrolase activator NlpD
MLGTFIAWSIARTHTPLQLGEKVGLGALFGTLTFIIEFYSQRDGSTDGGRYNPRIDPADTPYPDTRSDFAGYPDKAGSPYNLPYAADSAMYVGQANLGFFSHARWNSFPQIYAYDFAHDFGDEILAIRDGTVVDFFDWIPDNINPSTAQEATARTASNGVMGAGWRNDNPGWNFIAIRHDSRIDTQDRDQGGPPVTTYAIYGHGATEGVRALWQTLYGKTPQQIIGTRVRRGNPIMRAGSTGVSFHNHLHLHVLRGPAPPATPEPLGATQLVTAGALSSYTLPFVFADAPGDGVLKNLRWYSSRNARSTGLPP